MRVVVASDRVGALSSSRAGQALAEGWASAATAVVPIGDAGVGFAEATADGWEVPLVSGVLDGRLTSWAHAPDALVVAVSGDSAPDAEGGIPASASSYALGRALRHALWEREHPAATVLVDLAGLDTHDGGAGFLAALGATADICLDAGVAGLHGLGWIDLAAVRQLLAGARLVGVVPGAETARPLLGLRGITSLRGRADGYDPAELLATDVTLSRLVELVAPGGVDLPGAGACGGLGLAVLALGGTLATGPALALGDPRAAAALRRADLAVTGTGVFDFARRGGGVVAEMARRAGAALCPCIIVAGEVLVGAREMRTMGIEAAYAVRESTADAPAGGDVTAEELAATARRVSRSWSW
ncbi:glycerate kinase [uncultured Friedmanniella sp.]|uniref:glycerate kinase n=1 Tax=uncultured Friedmanniella sp. TaxID=335381 RepID=UPI0035CC961B